MGFLPRSGVSSTAGSGTSTGATGSGTSFGSDSGRSAGLSVDVMSDPSAITHRETDERVHGAGTWHEVDSGGFRTPHAGRQAPRDHRVRSGDSAPEAGSIAPPTEQAPRLTGCRVHPDVTDVVYWIHTHSQVDKITPDPVVQSFEQASIWFSFLWRTAE